MTPQDHIFEDSAFLKALDHPDHLIVPPDTERLTSQGLITKGTSGRFHLTESGVQAATELRDIERDLIGDEVLAMIDRHVSRADALTPGWAAGVSFYGLKARIDFIHPPHMASMRAHHWSPLAEALKDELSVMTRVEGDRLTLLLPHSLAATERIAAGLHARAVWSDLCNLEEPRVHWGYAPGDSSLHDPASFAFHYASRTVSLLMDEGGLYRVGLGVSGEPDAGRTWLGRRADLAVKAMCRDLYGKPCAHGYGTGRACPGCDAQQERFEGHHGVLGAMPGVAPSMTRIVLEGAEPMLTMSKRRAEW